MLAHVSVAKKKVCYVSHHIMCHYFAVSSEGLKRFDFFYPQAFLSRFPATTFLLFNQVSNYPVQDIGNGTGTKKPGFFDAGEWL
jgi:hypothetical protein